MRVLCAEVGESEVAHAKTGRSRQEGRISPLIHTPLACSLRLGVGTSVAEEVLEGVCHLIQLRKR